MHWLLDRVETIMQQADATQGVRALRSSQTATRRLTLPLAASSKCFIACLRERGSTLKKAAWYSGPCIATAAPSVLRFAHSCKQSYTAHKGRLDVVPPSWMICNNAMHRCGAGTPATQVICRAGYRLQSLRRN